MPPNAARSAIIGGSTAASVGRLAIEPSSPTHLDHRLARAQRLACTGQLSAGFAHEINTPIQYVSDSLRFLEEALGKLMPALRETNTTVATVPPDARELLVEIPECLAAAIEGIERIGSIVRAMQAVAVPGTDSQSVVSVNRLIETAIAATSGEWKYVATIELDLDPSLPPIVCFAGELLQAFVSILVNAGQAIAEARSSAGRRPRDGVIAVSTRWFGESIEVRVRDNGIGIAADVVDRVFDPFFATKPGDKAAGLGLALADRVARLHGGRVHVESKPDEGSTFTIALPIRDASA